MAQASRDQNFVPTLLGVSNVDGTTPITVYADPTTHRLLVDLAGGSGTVTSVSVVTANGFAGTVANATTTPAITISTTITSPVLAGNGTAISAATTTGSGSTVVLNNSPLFVDDITLGVAASATGSILFKGLTSGTVTLSTADAAGTWTMKLPTTDGNANEVLKTDGSGNTSWGTVESVEAQLPTYVVAASGGDFTTIQGALDQAAISYPNGALIYLTDETYTLTEAITFKSSGVEIIGNAGGTIISVDGSLYSPAVTSNADTYQRNGLRRLYFSQTNGTVQGVGFKAANMSLGIYEDVRFLSFGTAIDLNGSADNTFYNVFRDIRIAECNNGISIAGANAVNDNMFSNIRISLRAGGAGTGVAIARGQSNNFYNLNVEPATGAGITGLAITTANSFDNNFYGIYAENNATNVSIGAGALRNSFFGGQIILAGTTNVSNSGTETNFFGVDIGNTMTNTFSPLSAVDSGNAARIAGYFTNNTSFAHTGSSLVSAELKNGSDTSVLLRLTNAGTGNYITASTNFTVTKAGAVSSSAGFLPITNDTGALGSASLSFSDLFLAEGGVINWDNSDVTITQTGNVLAVAGGDLRVATADVGTNADSVPTLSSTSTLTSKTLTAPVINAATLNGTLTMTESTSLALDPAQGDATWTGITRAGTAGTTLAFGDLCYLASADSRWELTDADAASTSDRMLGMCVLAAAADGDPTVMLLMGNIRADSKFPAMTIGSAMYVGESVGTIQVAIPTGADCVIRRVGYALTADELYFNPSMDSQIAVA